MLSRTALLNSPFIDLTSSITFYEGTKMVLLFPIAILRVLINIKLATASVCCIYYARFTGLNVTNALLWIIRASVFVIGISVKTKGLKNLVAANSLDRNVVLVYNHISFMDQFILMTNGILAFITSYTYKAVPAVGPFLTYVESVFIIPKRGISQQLVDRLVQKKTNNRFMLAVAPEGALSNGRALLKFKTGAFVAKAPVLPVLIRYHYKHFCPAWTIDSPFLTCYRLLTQFVNYASVEYLPLVYSNENETAVEFAERVRCIMANALGIPMVPLDVNDKIELIKEYKMTLFRDDVVKN